MNEKKRVLPGRDTIEAYISESGFIALRQEDPTGDQDSHDSVVVMLPEDVPTVVAWPQELAEELKAAR